MASVARLPPVAAGVRAARRAARRASRRGERPPSATIAPRADATDAASPPAPSSPETRSSQPPRRPLGRRLALAGASLTASSAPLLASALVDDVNARDVFERAGRSVVGLADYVEGAPDGGYAPRGTGVVWTEFADGGFVVTNFHVVAPYVARDNANPANASSADAAAAGKRPPPKPSPAAAASAAALPPGARLRVSAPDATTGDTAWFDAVVVGTQRASDVAVLRVFPLESAAAAAEGSIGRVSDSPAAAASSSPPPPRLFPIPVGASEDARVGQSCYSMGANVDKGEMAAGRSFRRQSGVSAGVVSGLRRSVPSKNGTTIRNVIQTDAEVPESAAGGPLVDSSGRLLGMSVTTYGAKVSPGLSFAVPVDDLIKIVPSLITLHQVS